MNNSVMFRRLVRLSLVVCLTFLVTTVGIAQSGRRKSKAASSVPVVPAAEPAPTPAEKTEKEKVPFEMVVGIERGGGFDFVPLYYYSGVISTCTERLDKSPSVVATATQGSVSRAEAIAKAKAEQRAHVVWLQLRSDRVSADRGIDDVREIVVEYTVFAPTTAKIVTSGRSYQASVRKGPVVVSPTSTGRTSTAAAEYLLREAAKTAAERILSALHLSTGRTVP